MEECNICLTNKKRNKKKHERSKKHIFFSILITKKTL